MVSFRQLRFLVSLADELHFSRAADTCNVSQPTLSSGLKQLEDSLGIPLAERTKRSVILTPIGEKIAEQARSVLAKVADIERLAAHHTGPLHGDLHLGAIPTLGPFLIPKALPALRRAYPELRLYLREELTDSLLEGLFSGRLDVILIALPFEIGESAEIEFLFEDSYQLATSYSDPLASQKRIRGSDLNGRSLMLLEKGHCLQRHALSAFPDCVVPQDERFAATSLGTLISMVEEGLGITLLPQLAIDAGVAKGHAIEMRPIEGACPRQVAIAWRRTSPYAGDFVTLAAALRKTRAELGA
jgi:LysR family hydrogen peroxide-inducible transcriptional activator